MPTLHQPQTASVMSDHVKYVHDLAIEWATAAGIDQTERTDFAKIIVSYCLKTATNIQKINFGVHYTESGKCFLKAMIDSNTTIAEKEIRLSLNKTDLPLLKNLPELEELRRKNKLLEQANEDLKQFSFAIAHDLKNSLTKLKLAISLLEAETIPEGMKRYVQIIDRSARQLEETTLSLNELIELGHSAKGIVKKISLTNIFTQVYGEFEESILANNAEVIADFSRTDELIYVEIYLKSIFSNLISNAIKYRSPARRLSVNINSYKKDETVIIVFSDNGQGIDLKKNTREKLFQPFTRFAHDTEGKGLGLYIIKTMVERNGGVVEVDSTVQKGTTFTFTLQPYNPDEDVQA